MQIRAGWKKKIKGKANFKEKERKISIMNEKFHLLA
jgi:hypothetical protein